MQLKPAAQPQWLIPCDGLRVLMRPVATPVLVEARHLCRELAVAEKEATGAETLTPARLAYLMSIAMVAAGAVEWDGLSDEDGTALPQPTLEQVRQLLDQEVEVFDWFDEEYCTPLYLLLAEKKGSRRSPNGTSARTDPATATGARDSTATPNNPAPTTNTSPKPAKAG